MKINKIALVIGIGSCVWLVMAIYRWWFQWHDISNLIFGVAMGLGGLAGAYLYHWMRIADATHEELRFDFNRRMDVQYDEIQEIRKKVFP